MPRATLLGWIVAASDTLPVPSKLIALATISPVISKFLSVSSLVAAVDKNDVGTPVKFEPSP